MSYSSHLTKPQAVITLSTGMDCSWNTPLSASGKNQDLLWLKQYIDLKDRALFSGHLQLLFKLNVCLISKPTYFKINQSRGTKRKWCQCSATGCEFMVALDRFSHPSPYPFTTSFIQIVALHGRAWQSHKNCSCRRGNKNTPVSRTHLFKKRYPAAESTYFIKFTNPFNKLGF